VQTDAEARNQGIHGYARSSGALLSDPVAMWRLPIVRMIASRWVEIFVRLCFSVLVPRQMDTFCVSGFNSMLLMLGAALHDTSSSLAFSDSSPGSRQHQEADATKPVFHTGLNAWRNGNVGMARRFMQAVARFDMPTITSTSQRASGGEQTTYGGSSTDAPDSPAASMLDTITAHLAREDQEARRQRGKMQRAPGDSQSDEAFESFQEHWSHYSMCPNGQEMDCRTEFAFRGHVNVLSVQPVGMIAEDSSPIGPPWQHIAV